MPLEFNCKGCRELSKSYVGDGFDEFWEWRCKAEKNRLIGYDETFSRCELPSWCPKLKNVMKRMKVKINNK